MHCTSSNLSCDEERSYYLKCLGREMIISHVSNCMQLLLPVVSISFWSGICVTFHFKPHQIVLGGRNTLMNTPTTHSKDFEAKIYYLWLRISYPNCGASFFINQKCILRTNIGLQYRNHSELSYGTRSDAFSVKKSEWNCEKEEVAHNWPSL